MLEDEFSPCDISYSMLVGPGLDLAISNDTDNTTDYTQLADYEKMKTRVAEFQPDVFSIGMTDNMSANHNPDAAFRAYTEYIDMVYEQKSDVIIIFHYDNMVHVASKEKLVEKLYEKYKDRGFLVYHPDLVHDEYMALEWLDRDPPQPGVAAHLNDKGMNEVAKNLFEYTKQPLYYKLVPNYIYLPKGISVSGQNEITQPGGSVKLSVSAVPSDASKEVNWSVDNENIAVIDSKGTLTAKNNGKVTVRAESKYADGIYAVYTVSISGQPQSYTVTYNAGTLSDVTGLPGNDEYVRGEYTVSDIVPLRDCYTFVGWSLSENSSETVKSVTVNSDITLYAVWEKTVGFEFEGNYDENAGFTYGFDIEGGFHASVSDSCLSVACTAGQKVRYKSPKLDIPKTEYVSFALMSEHFDTDTTVELTLFTDKDAYKYNFKLSTSDMTVYSAYIGDVDASTVTGFEIYVNSVTEDGSIFPVSLDYARFENMVFASSKNASHRLYVGNSKSVNVRFDFGNVQSGVVIAAGYTAQNCMKFADILLPDDIVLELNGNDVLAKLRTYSLKSLETASPFAKPICIEIDR